jgi:hypothetical protein
MLQKLADSIAFNRFVRFLNRARFRPLLPRVLFRGPLGTCLPIYSSVPPAGETVGTTERIGTLYFLMQFQAVSLWKKSPLHRPRRKCAIPSHSALGDRCALLQSSGCVSGCTHSHWAATPRSAIERTGTSGAANIHQTGWADVQVFQPAVCSSSRSTFHRNAGSFKPWRREPEEARSVTSSSLYASQSLRTAEALQNGRQLQRASSAGWPEHFRRGGKCTTRFPLFTEYFHLALPRKALIKSRRS